MRYVQILKTLKADTYLEENIMGKIKCPHCHSTNVEFMQNNHKSFSVGKAAVGGVLTGGIGVIAGFAGKKGKNQFFCRDCNRTFEHK